MPESVKPDSDLARIQEPNAMADAGDAIIASIRAAKLSIKDGLKKRPDLFIPTALLEEILNTRLAGLILNEPPRTRSKTLKTAVCHALGYEAPSSFSKTTPQFVGQDFDTYTQQSDNLQIWNEEISPTRRYVLVRPNAAGKVVRVRVVTGAELALLDTTGTLTSKYQAAAIDDVTESKLVSSSDTANIIGAVNADKLLPVKEIYKKLQGLLGTSFDDPGSGKDRVRGDIMHKQAAKILLGTATDNRAQCPDIPQQLVEVKLQTARTIDLGRWQPDSAEKIDDLPSYSYADVRYAIFYGEISKGKVRLNHLIVTTGVDFFSYFQRFEGVNNGVNKKLQIPLPVDFFR